MSIGLYDVDLILYTQVPFNLELMKLAAYYKKNREIVSLSPYFNPDMYSSFIMRKDYNDGVFPNNISDYNNIQYGGYAFSGEKYIPLPSDIEKMKPDTSIYTRFEDNYSNTNLMQTQYRQMMNATHIRVAPDGINADSNIAAKYNIDDNIRTIFFHDYDLNKIKDGHEAVKEIMERVNKNGYGYLGLKFPITTKTYEDLLFWCSFKSTSAFYKIQHFGIIEDEQLVDLVNHYDYRYSILRFDYIITSNFKDQEDFIKNGLQKIYRQILFLRMRRTKILLKYENNFFIDKRWENIIDLFNSFLIVTSNLNYKKFKQVIAFDSLYSFASHFKEEHTSKKVRFTKSEVRDMFQLVRETNYEAFKDFYDTHTVKLVGGKFESWKEEK